ncbi:unnamed protein product [Cuscuta europaea]|uniref:Uncharacterized protein n=1 Tax=Cuscuta europaea TaxID=41803 RepID=A0A9P1E541_CUSEU|nr:unnamed protein product [Cuscuta europaea]
MPSEFRLDAFENARLYKERAKKWHDGRILRRDFSPGDSVLLFNSRLKLFPGKLKSKWSGPFKVIQAYPSGAIILEGNDGRQFTVNGQRVNQYHEGDDTKEKLTVDLDNPPYE